MTLRFTRIGCAAACAALVAALSPSVASAALDATTICHAKKLDTARGYGACRLKAVSKSVKKSTPADFSRCALVYSRKWQKIELAAGPLCSTSGDELDIGDEVITDTEVIASMLETGGLPLCGDGVINGRETCDGAELASADCFSFGFTGGTLGCGPSCRLYDLTGCTGRQILSATGQTLSYKADLLAAPEQNVDDDGALQAGGPLSFVDNGDGTVTDLNSGLMWEKKGNNGGLHEVEDVYPWSNDATSTIWDWLAAVNSEGGTGFAGHSDWRIPNQRELATLLDYSRVDPAVSPAFNTVCVPGCAITECSCTQSKYYWSSTTSATRDTLGWAVDFARGGADDRLKGSNRPVRAVRRP